MEATVGKANILGLPVKLSLDQPGGFAKPSTPADG